MGTDRTEIEAGVHGALVEAGLYDLSRAAMILELRECEQRKKSMEQMLEIAVDVNEAIGGSNAERLEARLKVVNERIRELLEALWPIPDQGKPGEVTEVTGR